MTLSDLPKSQRRLLIDLVSKGYLFRTAAGWEACPVPRRTYHSNRAMRAIVRLGLCLINTDGGWAKMGSAVPSRLGRDIVETHVAHALLAKLERGQ